VPDSQLSPTDIVTRFCDAWTAVDIDAICAFFAPDAVYHNMPLEPVTGVDAIRTTIEGFTGGVDRIEFRIVNLAADGPVVLTERVDAFITPDRTIELPVMGTFEIDGDGRIAAWRDYFDLNQFMSQMTS
jgi:limonene-1,2-epoxide hydrolase